MRAEVGGGLTCSRHAAAEDGEEEAAEDGGWAPAPVSRRSGGRYPPRLSECALTADRSPAAAGAASLPSSPAGPRATSGPSIPLSIPTTPPRSGREGIAADGRSGVSNWLIGLPRGRRTSGRRSCARPPAWPWSGGVNNCCTRFPQQAGSSIPHGERAPADSTRPWLDSPLDLLQCTSHLDVTAVAGQRGAEPAGEAQQVVPAGVGARHVIGDVRHRGPRRGQRSVRAAQAHVRMWWLPVCSPPTDCWSPMPCTVPRPRQWGSGAAGRSLDGEQEHARGAQQQELHHPEHPLAGL